MTKMKCNQSSWSKHKYPNTIAICDICQNKVECEVNCSCPKDRVLHFRCKDCIEKDRLEQKKFMEELGSHLFKNK